MKNRASWHDYQIPSGQGIKLQGYEPLALDKLLEDYGEDEILYRKSDMPEIGYLLKSNWHRYYPDFYIPKDNMVVEVKSSFTYNYDRKKNVTKKEATKELGYNYNLMIFDNKKEFINKSNYINSNK